MMDRKSQDEVDEYNKMQTSLTNLSSPEKEIESQNAEQQLENMFGKLFGDGDDAKIPEPIEFKVGDAYKDNAEFDNYLSQVNKNKK